MSIETLAAELAGNHFEIKDFAWSNRPDDGENWALVYTHNRDSGIITRVNAEIIAETLEPFEDDAVPEHHSHWACGWIDGFAIRVYAADGSITPAFWAYAELMSRLDDYPVLDESRLSAAEYAEMEESWEAYGRYDFRRTLQTAGIDFDGREADDLEPEEIDAMWQELAQCISWDYQFDGSGCNFNIDGAIEYLMDFYEKSGRLIGFHPSPFAANQKKLGF